MKKVIYTNKAPNVVGPYSQAIVAGDFVFCSGQIGLDPKTNELVKGIEKQTRQVMKNLQEVLKEAKTDFTNVVQTTIYLKSMNDYAVVNSIYASYLKKDPPARAAIEIAKLPKDALIEISCTAFIRQ